jgi:hypothetical protein
MIIGSSKQVLKKIMKDFEYETVPIDWKYLRVRAYNPLCKRYSEFTPKEIPEKKIKSFEGLRGLGTGINRLSVCSWIFTPLTTYKAFSGLETLRTFEFTNPRLIRCFTWLILDYRKYAKTD